MMKLPMSVPLLPRKNGGYESEGRAPLAPNVDTSGLYHSIPKALHDSIFFAYLLQLS